MIDRLVLVYAADSTLGALLVDVAKKLVGAAGCTLRDTTHGATGERASWRACRAELGVPVDTFHQDDAPEGVRTAAAGAWPSVLARSGPLLRVVLGPEAIARCGKQPAALRDAILAACAGEGLARTADDRGAH